MQKLKARKVVIMLIILLFVAAYLFYSRPMTMHQLYPTLTLDKCTAIHGYYEIGMQTEQTKFSIEKDSDEFQELCSLFYEREYRRSLRDLFPRGGRTHRTEPNDYQWEVFFRFEDIEFPDGSIGSGEILRFQNWYGELDIYVAGEEYACHTGEQIAWSKEVLNRIQ